MIDRSLLVVPLKRHGSTQLIMLFCLLSFPGVSIGAHSRWWECTQENQDEAAFEKLAMDYCHRLAKARDPESDLILDEFAIRPWARHQDPHSRAVAGPTE
jgi:hypothetical protein